MPHSSFYCSFYFLKKPDATSICILMYLLSSHNWCRTPTSSASYFLAFFLWSAPVAFRRVALETPEWTSRDSNHRRQSVSAGKTNAIPTEPSGRLLLTFSQTCCYTPTSAASHVLCNSWVLIPHDHFVSWAVWWGNSRSKKHDLS